MNTALVMRNGHAREREVVTVADAVPVSAPRINEGINEDGELMRFRSAILPPYARRSPAVTEVMPLLNLDGLSTKDFVPDLAEHFGTSAGLSASVTSRLTSAWDTEVEAFMNRDLSKTFCVYCCVDGVHFNIRVLPRILRQRKIC